MANTSAELQRALVGALKAHAGLAALIAGRVFDQTPAAAPFPYLTLGRLTSLDWSTSTERGSEYIVTINVWSKGKGKKEALGLMALVDEALHDRPMTLTGCALVNLRLESSELSYDDDQAVHHGAMRFRAMVEG